MYNRYIPADDGTYRRQIVEDRQTKEQPCEPPPILPQRLTKETQREEVNQEIQRKSPKIQFFKGIDTGDLLILLILLLVLSEKGEDNTSLLLTAALYFLLQ